MRWILILLAICGIAASSLALREHYRTDSSPCSINERWDCGIVNHSPYAVIGGVVASLHGEATFQASLVNDIPVAVVGIAGYVLLGILAFKKAYRLALLGAVGGLAFSLYLARIEARLLGVWCVYCVISLGVISLMAGLGSIQVAVNSLRRADVEETKAGSAGT